MDPRKHEIGILGGGQLGKMLLQAASPWHLVSHVLDPTPDCPAADLATHFTCGSFRDYEQVMAFGRHLDRITIEIEDVNLQALRDLQSMGKQIYPHPDALAIIQDKGRQKQFYSDEKLPTSSFQLYGGKADVLQALENKEVRLPFVQKLRTGGYDGRGVQVVRKDSDLVNLFDAPCVVEQMVEIDKELAVIVARNRQGEVAAFPPVEMVFHPTANLVEMLAGPADITEEQTREATVLAVRIIKALRMEGILAVELFLDKSGHIWINEIAPRPHNSGHHTIESCYTSQYEQHLRAIFNWPLGSTTQHHPAAMINLLGEPGHEGPAVYQGFERCLAQEGVYVHLYGKATTKPFRKMGHVTILAATFDDAVDKARQVRQLIKVTT